MRETSFGDWLHRMRRAAGLTQKEVAARVFVKPLAVSRWETGVQIPGIERRRALEAMFDELGVMTGGAPIAISEKQAGYAAIPTSIPLYLLGHIAGTTDGEGERIEDMEVPPRLGRLADSAFVLHGSSMEPYFLNGDIVGIRATPIANEGQLVVAQADGELTFKRFDGVADGRTILSALNPSHRPILPTEMKIVGVYRWSIRERKDGRI